MFDLENARRKRGLRVASRTGHGTLNDDGTFVHSDADEVNRRAMFFHAGLERAAMRVEPFELRQQAPGGY